MEPASKESLNGSMVSGGKDETAADAAASGGHLGSGLGAVATLTLTVVKLHQSKQTLSSSSTLTKVWRYFLFSCF